MNYRFFAKIILTSSICFGLSTYTSESYDDRIVQDVPLEMPIIDPSEAQDVDYTFYNDPYVFDQQKQQPLVDLHKAGIFEDTKAEISEDNAPVIDESITYDIDFTFFNDPYAFENFRNLPIKAKFGGYVQYSSWWDSRQVITFGEGYILLFPEAKLYDADCKDINARGNYNAGFLETRLRSEFFGPKVLGAESYAYVETDFFGSGLVANRLRIRNALSKLTWNPSEALFGQFWNPTFEPKCYPLTVDFGVGLPNAIFARNPQIRYTYKKNKKEFIIAAAAQIEQVNTGPLGPSSIYLRNSRTPMLYARGAYDSDTIYAGVCIGYQRIAPRIVSTKGYKVNEAVNSCIALLFAKYVVNTLEVRQNLIFSQNATNLNLLGGYAVTTVNPVTDQRSYTNLNTLSYWFDLNVKRKVEPGIFIGIAKNFGARKNIIPCIKNIQTNTEENTVYGLGVTINTLFRISPRIRYHVLPADFCAEIEFVRAAYGCLNEKAQVKNLNPVTNIRLLLTTFYYF